MSRAQKNNKNHSAVCRLIAAGCIVIATIALIWVFPLLPAEGFSAYRLFTKVAMNALATVFSFVPFTVFDFIVVGAIVVIIAGSVRVIIKNLPLLPWVSGIILAFSICLFWTVGAWGCNHFAPPLSDDVGLEIVESSKEDLAEATLYYLNAASELADKVPRDAEGALAEQDFSELAAIAGAAYEQLSERYPVFEGCILPVKQLVLFGEALLYTGANGVFIPLTGEANVPANCLTVDKPFVMCHEASHRLGIASEDEANFAAFLACIASDDVRFQYSGYYSAFVYCFSALCEVDAEYAGKTFARAHDERCLIVLEDVRGEISHYSQYEGVASDVGQAMNDTYLRAFSEDGVQSYGQVVDYLLAWHKAL